MQFFVKESARKYRAATPAELITATAAHLHSELIGTRFTVDAPAKVKAYLAAELSHLDREVFGVLFLTHQHDVIKFETLFLGTLSQTSVYPREVAKAALLCNASALVLAHNHPSGVAEPSRADEVLTKGLQASCGLVDVRILDHIIVGKGGATVSFAERGLI